MFRTAPMSIIVSERELSANVYDINHCCVYSEKLMMMDSGTVRNM